MRFETLLDRYGRGELSQVEVAALLGVGEQRFRRWRDRRVGNDNTVAWRGLTLQIPPNPLRAHFVRATGQVHEYTDGRLAVFHTPHRLADYDPGGNLRDDQKLAA
ncbi:MAG: hypothetical protein ACREFB_17720 [Stellaceae bacterium]